MINQANNSKQNRLKHLSWRSGFGQDDALTENRSEEGFLKSIFNAETYHPQPLFVPEMDEVKRMLPERRNKWTSEMKKAFRETNRKGTAHLNLTWIHEMAITKHPFLEKMSLFWHGHFACRGNNVVFNQQLIDVIRKHALGSFRDLLFEVSKSPAMLQFLNNQQNRKSHPNENFAREVMELFTMGRDQYTEKDIKEGARGFTGWGYNREGAFIFKKKFHDEGVKIFLGKTGNFDGNDLLDIILEKKATAYFITRKIVRYFVNDHPKEEIIRPLAEKFYQSGYRISELMNQLFHSEDFYRNENCANRIKSPVELLVGMQRSIPVHFDKEKIQIRFQRLMGQTLFYPPNVGGWPGGRSWIDSATIIFRLRLPQIIYASSILDKKPKDMPDELSNYQAESDDMKAGLTDPFLKKIAKRVKTEVNWETYETTFRGVEDTALPEAISDRLLAQPNNAQIALVKQYARNGSRADKIKKLSIMIMGQPEYQLC